MLLDLEALQALDAIERKGSFARAAAELDRVPSAITYLVRKLEDQLDVLLFDRSGHKARLTPAGRQLLDDGRHLLFAASELARRVKRTGDGWEVELRLAVDTIVRMEPVLALIARFYANEPGTRIRVVGEVLSGTWDALFSGRADLALGTTPSPPGATGAGSGYQTLPLGDVEFVFAVAPDHPLAAMPEPLAPEAIRRHRAVAVGDSVRNLPTVTVGLLGGQDVLTVPTMRDKVDAQVAGLGCGNVPLRDASPHLQAGRLVAKRLAETRAVATLHYAWNTGVRGRAMRWFLAELARPDVRRALLS